jgi:hypothetical protein
LQEDSAYDIYFAAHDDTPARNAQLYPSMRQVRTLADTYPPYVFTINVRNDTGSSIELGASATEPVTLYAVVMRGVDDNGAHTPQPTSAQIVGAAAAANNGVIVAGAGIPFSVFAATWSAPVAYRTVFTTAYNLASETEYRLHVACSDLSRAANLQPTTTSITVTTRDATPPTTLAADVFDVTGTSFRLAYRSTEPGIVYMVLLEAAAYDAAAAAALTLGEPLQLPVTAEQVFLGVAGAPHIIRLIASADDVIVATFNDLIDRSAYDVYIIAADEGGTDASSRSVEPNFQTTPDRVRVNTLDSSAPAFNTVSLVAVGVDFLVVQVELDEGAGRSFGKHSGLLTCFPFQFRVRARYFGNRQFPLRVQK